MSIFVSFCCTVLMKITCLCLFDVTMIYRMNWLTAMALIWEVLDCFSFAINGAVNCCRAVGAKNTTTKQQIKTKLQQHLKKQPSAPKSGRIALFCFKIVTFCVPPLFSFAAGKITVTYLASLTWHLEIKVIARNCVRFNLEFPYDFDPRI